MIEVKDFDSFCLTCDPALVAAVVRQFGNLSLFALFALERQYLGDFGAKEKFSKTFNYLSFFQNHQNLIKNFYSNICTELGTTVLAYLEDERIDPTGNNHQTEDSFFNSSDSEVIKNLVWLIARHLGIDYLDFIYNRA